MYCPTELHDSTSTHPNLEKLKQSWLSFYHKTQHIGLPYKISFSGGEVTANRSFLPLVKFIRDGNYNIGQILVVTNGSASKSYYLKLAELIDSLGFSTHSEYFDERKFFSNVEATHSIMTQPKKIVHVNIMNEFWNQDRIPIYQKWLDQRGIGHSVNTIDYSHKTRVYPLIQGKQNLE